MAARRFRDEIQVNRKTMFRIYFRRGSFALNLTNFVLGRGWKCWATHIKYIVTGLGSRECQKIFLSEWQNGINSNEIDDLATF